jgi:hypothetical protein
MSELDDLLKDDYGDDLSEGLVLDLEKVKKNITEFSSDKLCEIVVSNRYLNFNEEVAVLCMEELARRRQNGDIFTFESVIADKQKELPPLDAALPDLRSILGQLSNIVRNK